MSSDPGSSGGGSRDGDNDDPLVGTLVDRRYRVLNRLGDGGMGIVYKAEHIFLNKNFALKVMRPTRDAVDRARFEQEAQLASKIRHKNVTEISDFGVLPTGQPYFVMEYLVGNTLGEAIFEGRIDPLLACHIAAQIASGLQAVHKQNVVHRDLKPDNIFLIDPDQVVPAGDDALESGEWSDIHFVKIMDFGIAKSVDKNLTGTGMTLGTPEYMSPEQATGDKIDWRSDQYSLGAMLYEMLTGELPFVGKSAFEIMNKHLNEPPIPLRQRRPEGAQHIPPQLEKIVLTMMNKKAALRLPSMRAVESSLRDVVATMRQNAPPLSPLLKTVVTPPRTEPGGPPLFLPDPPTAPLAQASLVDTLRNGKPPAHSDAETRPILQAIPKAPEPAPPPPAPPPKPAPVPSHQAKTLLMSPPAETLPMPLAEAITPTPRLIDKLVLKVRPSAPELEPAGFWNRFAITRWLVGHLRRLFPALFS